MTELKTKANDESVEHFMATIAHPTRHQDATTLLEIYKSVTQQAPQMWGSAIIGFGSYAYTNSAGKTNTWMRSGFSPRKQYMSLYLMAGIEKHPELLSQLGKHKHGKSCLNINKLADIDLHILRQLIEVDIRVMNEKYPITESS